MRFAPWSAVLTLPLIAGQPANTSAEIDASLWKPASAAVAADDIVALGKTYHPAAVVVTRDGTRPVAQALDGWGKNMVAAKKIGTKASVTFRFTRRQDDATTGFESGIFNYTTTTKAGVAKASYVRFEALVVKHEGRWVTLMERQLEPVTVAEWNAAPH